MIKTTTFKNAKLNYSDQGSGKALVLLHGYLESLRIYDPIVPKLAENNRVICIDIPGHGESGTISAIHSMDDMAEAVLVVLDELNIEKCYLAGHSMGGYVTMAFVSMYSERLHGFCLLHSTPFADPDEKKMNRDREIDLIREGKKNLIVESNIPKAFANDNRETMKDEVERAKSIARLSPEEGVISLLNGMRERIDRSATLENTRLPHLWVLGKKDNYIDYNGIKGKLNILGQYGISIVLENSGHMGFIEETDEAVQLLKDFCR